MEIILNLNKQALETENLDEALKCLQTAVGLLEFYANSGKVIDRNLIITILYNIAAVHRETLQLESACQYMEGLIFNLEQMVANEFNDLFLIKRLHFLMICRLQFCGILSQLGQHKVAAEIAESAVQCLQRIIKSARRHIDRCVMTPRRISRQQKGQLIVEECDFKHGLFERSLGLLDSIDELLTLDLETFNDFSIINWKLNVNQNQKQFRDKFKIKNSLENRSLLGLLNENKWLEGFNIGQVMNPRLVSYEDVCLKGELLYEFSQKLLVERALLLSIANFTIATELRFLNDPLSPKYHLKSIYVACCFSGESFPYLDHLIESYQRNNRNNLETILEETSFQDQSTKTSLKRQASNYQRLDRDNLKELLRSLSKDKEKKEDSVKRTLQKLQWMKERALEGKGANLKRFKTEPNVQLEERH